MKKNLKPSHCSECGKVLDTADSADGDGARPSPGDLSICSECGHLAIVTDDKCLRELTSSEKEELKRHPEYAKVQELVSSAEKRRAIVVAANKPCPLNDL